MQRIFFVVAIICCFTPSCNSQNNHPLKNSKEQVTKQVAPKKFDATANLPDELFGFRLGQYKSVVTNELG